MAGIFDKLIDFMNLNDDEPNEHYEEDQEADLDIDHIDHYNERRHLKSYSGGRDTSSKISSVHTSIQMEVSVVQPTGINDAKEICTYLTQNKPVIINLEQIEHAEAQRIMDFISGCCYTLEGTVQKLTSSIFIIAPANVDITGNFKEELKTNGIILPWKGE